MDTRLKIGLCGTGHLGEIHLKNMQAMDSLELAGFFEIDRSRAEMISKKYSLPSYPSLSALLKDVDALSVVVPTTEHYKIARSALQNGVHVFVEKPFTSTLEEADELITLSRKKNLILQVGHIERYNPALQSLRGISLNPFFIESHRISSFPARGTDVAVILDLMIHDIDIILTLVKEPIREIHASGIPVLTPNIDIANARIIFENGAVANVTASRVSAKSMRKLRIFQPQTYISIDFLNNLTEIYRIVSSDEPVRNGEKTLRKISQEPSSPEIRFSSISPPEDNPLRKELESFVKSIRTGAQPPVTGEDGRKALAVALQIEKLIQTSLESLPKSITGI